MTSAVSTRSSIAVSAAAAVAGLLLLMVRADVARHTGAAATPLLAALFVVLVSGLAPALPPSRSEAGDAIPVLLIGLVAFAAGRIIGGGHPLLPATTTAIGLNTLAAVAEEAFFRRLLFGLLAVRSGVAAGIAGSAVLFALIHVPVYGWWVVPIDLAAGLVLGWQRAATGSWLVPAATHAAANILVVL